MDLDILKIDLKGLADGLNSFEFDLDDAYFKAVNAPEVGRGNVHVSLKIVRLLHTRFPRKRNGCTAVRPLLGRYGATYRDTTAS